MVAVPIHDNVLLTALCDFCHRTNIAETIIHVCIQSSSLQLQRAPFAQVPEAVLVGPRQAYGGHGGGANIRLLVRYPVSLLPFVTPHWCSCKTK